MKYNFSGKPGRIQCSTSGLLSSITQHALLLFHCSCSVLWLILLKVLKRCQNTMFNICFNIFQHERFNPFWAAMHHERETELCMLMMAFQTNHCSQRNIKKLGSLYLVWSKSTRNIHLLSYFLHTREPVEACIIIKVFSPLVLRVSPSIFWSGQRESLWTRFVILPEFRALPVPNVLLKDRKLSHSYAVSM